MVRKDVIGKELILTQRVIASVAKVFYSIPVLKMASGLGFLFCFVSSTGALKQLWDLLSVLDCTAPWRVEERKSSGWCLIVTAFSKAEGLSLSVHLLRSEC